MFRVSLHLLDGYYFITIAWKMANYAHISQSVVVVSLVRYIYSRKVALTCVKRVKDLLLGLTHSNYNRSLYNLTIYFPVCLEDKFGTNFTIFFLILFLLSYILHIQTKLQMYSSFFCKSLEFFIGQSKTMTSNSFY